jgi:hypothetical protein
MEPAMKTSPRLGPVVGALLAVLAVAGVAVHGLLRPGSEALAIAVAIAGAAAVLAVAWAWSLAREAEQQLRDLLPPLPAAEVDRPAARKAVFRVREARPGEVPEPYLAAVMKGAQARQAAWKASKPEHHERV